MQYAIRAVIETELLYDISLLIESTAPATYLIEVYEYADGSRYQCVEARYGGGAPQQAARNNREKLKRDLAKQVDIYGGLVELHICNNEEGQPCIIEEVTTNGGGANDNRAKRTSRLLER